MKSLDSRPAPALLVALLVALALSPFLFQMTDCPPCKGKGAIVHWQSPTYVVVAECRLCTHTGKIRLATRLGSDLSPAANLGQVTATTTLDKPLP